MNTEQESPRKGYTWLPLGGGWTEQDKKELEEKFGKNWRDLFNGL